MEVETVTVSTLVLFFCGLFSDAASSLRCVASNDMILDILQIIWKKGAVIWIEVIFQNISKNA